MVYYSTQQKDVKVNHISKFSTSFIYKIAHKEKVYGIVTQTPPFPFCPPPPPPPHHKVLNPDRLLSVLQNKM
jgi:hypothetical protein